LTLIKKSYGKRYTGRIVADYSPGDLVLVGSNLPHCWISESEPEEDGAQAVVFQFQQNFAGKTFLELPELRPVKKLILPTNSGVVITGSTRQQITEMIDACIKNNGFERLIIFVEILNLIAVTSEKEIIDPQFSEFLPSASEKIRFQKVFAFLIENYHHEISLKTIADIANLTPTAFCRFFKTITHKTFVEAITEFRVNEARRLLSTSDKSALEICFESGFGNISYFNKTFKTVTGNTPLQYRKLYR
jgi:AraC-like DNA-binding protein